MTSFVKSAGLLCLVIVVIIFISKVLFKIGLLLLIAAIAYFIFKKSGGSF
jgi:hypothetical protein